MSTAVYPLGMNSMPASGYNHKSSYYNKQYASWKGTGPNSFPVGTAPGHIRPLTNNDSGNNFQTGFGLPRPIKHYRKGRVIVAQYDLDPQQQYNLDRFVRSSKGTSLGGGFGGSGLLNDMQDKPGAFTVNLNPPNEINGIDQMDRNCKSCQGIAIVANYKPNNGNLLENPEPNTMNPVWCCNQERNAKRRVIYASTNLNKNYYTTTKQYLQNRCKTYDQKAFNFLSHRTNEAETPYGENNPYFIEYNKAGKPGGPLALTNTYLANCQMNTQLYEGSELAFIYQMLGRMLEQNILSQSEVDAFNATGVNTIQGFFNWIQTLPEPQKTEATNEFVQFIRNPYWGMPPSGPTNPAACQLTVYKPNNYQYATQGAVESSTRMLKLNVNTVTTNAASIRNDFAKNKAPACNTPWPLNMSQSGPFQNKKLCYFKQMPSFQVPAVQPSPYRYFPGTIISSNHFSQSPNTYNTSSR